MPPMMSKGRSSHETTTERLTAALMRFPIDLTMLAPAVTPAIMILAKLATTVADALTPADTACTTLRGVATETDATTAARSANATALIAVTATKQLAATAFAVSRTMDAAAEQLAVTFLPVSLRRLDATVTDANGPT